MKVYLVRGLDRELYLYQERPTRVSGGWYSKNSAGFILPKDLVNLKWLDEPLEVDFNNPDPIRVDMATKFAWEILKQDTDDNKSEREIARLAVSMADALLEELDKPILGSK